MAKSIDDKTFYAMFRRPLLDAAAKPQKCTKTKPPQLTLSMVNR
jgi:hypothetical protein